MSRLHKFPLLSKAEVASSPSRADGVPENMENRHRKLAAQHLREVSFKFQMSITTWAIAVTFFNRFYARKSMKKNNSFVVACASLFLAGKVNNEPRPHTKLANEMLKAWYGKDNPQLQALATAQQHQLRQGGQAAPSHAQSSPDFFDNLYASVLEAERALLYTVGFDFNVDIIHTHIARLLKRPRFEKLNLRVNKTFCQFCLGIANDVYGKDGALALMYPVEKIAIAAYYFVFKAAKANKMQAIPQPEQGASGTPWYVDEGLSAAECVDITTRFTDRLYSAKPAAKGKLGGQAASTAVTAGGAGASALPGACVSAAYSGGGPTLGGGGMTELASGTDALGEHTSIPRPLSSDVASGSKRAADGPPISAATAAAAPAAGSTGQAHPSKRPREEEPAAAGSTEATSAAAHPSANGQVAHQPRPAASANGAAPDAAASAAAVPAAKAPLAAAPAAAALAEDSEKEEGELDEGEL